MSIQVHIVTHHVVEVENHDDMYAEVAKHLELISERGSLVTSATHIGDLPEILEAGMDVYPANQDTDPGIVWAGVPGLQGREVGLDRGDCIKLAVQSIRAAKVIS